MLIGVVSDTHNNLKNIDTIISIFNNKKVDLVIHTGDITNSRSLKRFSNLSCDLFGVYGNNDREEKGLLDVVNQYNFNFQEPPYSLKVMNKNIVIFHEPELIDQYLKENIKVDIVLHGHTHKHRYENKNGILLFNPGESAGMLKGKNALGIINLNDLTTERIFF